MATTSSSSAHAPRAKFTSPFAPLALSHDEEETLEHLSRVILRNYMAQFEAFECEGGVVDERVWKPVKQREGLRAFVERKKDSDTLASDLRLSVQSFASSTAMLPPDLPVMLMVGSIPGALNDLIYGLMGNSTNVVRIRTSYADDYVDDTAVLATLVTPTQGDPFMSLTLRWVHHQSGQGILRAAVSARDFVIMERTGFALTPSGERLGFHLLHSVHFPQTSYLPGLIRANMSACCIYRGNAAQNQVSVFMHGITDAGGSMLHHAVTLSSANTFTSIRKYVETAYRKKLMWRLRQSRKTSVSVTSSNADCATSDDRGETGAKDCAVCGKTPSAAKALLPGGRLRSCALCSKLACSSCRVKKSLSQVTSAGRLEQHKFSFCSACFGDACRSDALAIARAEAASDTKQSVESFSKWSGSLSSISSE